MINASPKRKSAEMTKRMELRNDAREYWEDERSSPVDFNLFFLDRNADQFVPGRCIHAGLGIARRQLF